MNILVAFLMRWIGYLFFVISFSNSFLAVVRKSFSLYVLVIEYEWSLPMMEPM